MNSILLCIDPPANVRMRLQYKCIFCIEECFKRKLLILMTQFHESRYDPHVLGGYPSFDVPFIWLQIFPSLPNMYVSLPHLLFC